MKYLLVSIVLLGVVSSCMKPCPVQGCKMIHDHVHFFGGSWGSGKVVDKEEAIKAGKLQVFSGMPWYRRLFKRNYYTETGLKYKNFNWHQHRAKNKEDWHAFSGKAKYPGKEKSPRQYE